jgi:hypothetical protein
LCTPCKRVAGGAVVVVVDVVDVVDAIDVVVNAGGDACRPAIG